MMAHVMSSEPNLQELLREEEDEKQVEGIRTQFEDVIVLIVCR